LPSYKFFTGSHFARETIPQPVQPTGGSSGSRRKSQYLIINRRCRSLELAADRETVQAVRILPHRHHPPGIKNCQSAGYAEICRDRLRSRLRKWCTCNAAAGVGLSSMGGGLRQGMTGRAKFIRVWSDQFPSLRVERITHCVLPGVAVLYPCRESTHVLLANS
jgi:hypothetical protein